MTNGVRNLLGASSSRNNILVRVELRWNYPKQPLLGLLVEA
jgi:hypothetical protein